jgi:hypothetical protein
MSVNVLTIKNAVKNLIEKNNTNTSTYDISNGLQGKVKTISSSNSEKQPILNLNYPAIFVEVKSESDDYYLIGNSNNRSVEVSLDIVSIVDFGIANNNAREESDDELLQLTQNIQDLFRNNISVSSTVDSCLIENTDYDAEYAEDIYNSQSRISMIIKKRG